MENIEKDSFVVISDFHSYEWPLSKVTDYYLNEYDKIFILGDATDRGPYGNGEGGIDLLLEIKELTRKYPGRVFYIPGNHDEFLYGYMAEKDFISIKGLERNHGWQTMIDYDNLDFFTSFLLKNWLGNQPIQLEHFYKGRRYVLAHALFDQETFRKNHYFSLIDYRKSGGNYGPHKNILWFRKDKDEYDPERLPKKGTTMIVGHTPLCFRENKDLNLQNSDGDTIDVICVDGGIAYDDSRMLKYSAAYGKNGLFGTAQSDHNNTGCNTRKKEKNIDISEETKNKADELILFYIIKYGSVEEAIYNLLFDFTNTKDSYFEYHIDEKNVVNVGETLAYFNEIFYSYMEKCKNNYHLALKIHFIEVAMDYISKCQLEKFKTVSEVAARMNLYLDEYAPDDDEELLSYFTNSIGGARELLYKVGKNNVKFWLENNNYSSYKDYLSKKFGKQYK